MSLPDFNNTQIAYERMSLAQLKKAERLYALFNNTFLVDVGGELTEFAFKIGLPIKWVVRDLVYNQFCGGESLREIDMLVSHFATKNIGILLNFGVEAKETEEEYKFSFEENMRAFEFAAQHKNIQAVCLKFTSLCDLELLEELQQGNTLNESEQKSYTQLKVYIEKLCQQASVSNTALYIDAEESWIQDVIDNLCLEMQAKYNIGKCVVYNTYQLYRNDKLASLKQDVEAAREKGFLLGAKLVRGAYVDKENEHAKKKNIPSVIHTNKAAVDADFDEAVNFCLNNIEQLHVCVASHNENSNSLLTKKMDELGIARNHPHVLTSQLYGMGDHITYNLQAAQINVSKYLPYGPVKEVIQYLIRRAKENSSVEGQMGRELSLIRKEISRREK